MKSVIKQILREEVTREERVKFDMSVPSDITELANIFKKNNHSLMIVGGAVRDALLNIKPKDFDLVTDALPDKVEEILNDSGYKTLPTGKAFGVINVFTKNDEYEIATMREDGDYSDSRRPDSVKFADIYSDSARRDLTINALYYDIYSHEVIDLVGGINDLKNGIVRTVGNPANRFNEDKLRKIRIIRFAARLGNPLDKDSDAALLNDSSLNGVSGERIRDEFIKGINSAKSQKFFLELLEKYHLFDWIFKGLNVNTSFISKMKKNYDDYIILISSLLINNNIELLKKTLNGLKYSVDEVKAITFLIAMLKLSIDTAVTLKKAEQFSGVSKDQINLFCSIHGVDNSLLKAFNQFHLTISGEEVMDKMGIKPGPELGKEITRQETLLFKNLLK